ncbi:MAG: DEAD/DEAH box helicase, partial [Bacteroidota bacterium]|nr:DEAD/DEAH box helicase [Bacteroidota bacterium]
MKKFIIGIREHPSFGYTAIPLIVGNCNDEYCKIIRSVVFQDIIDSPQEYTELQKEIVSIIDNYSDDNIYAYYNRSKKKLSITDYFASIEKETIDKVIRPYIEKHLSHLFKMLENKDIEIFYKPYRYEYIYFTDKVTISPVPAKAIFNFERTEEGIKYFLSISFEGRDIPIFQKKPIVMLNKPGLIELEHILMYLEEINANKLKPFYSNEYVSVRKETELTYFKNFILKTVRDYNVKAKGFEIINLKPEKKAQLWIENDWLGEYAIIPKFNYNGKVFKNGDELNNFVDFNEKDFSISKFSRDKEWEQKHIDFLLKTNLFQKDENVFKVNFEGKDKDKQHDISINWLNQNHKIIEDFGFEIVQRFSTKKYYVKKISLEFKVKNKIDWFDIYAIVRIGEFKIPFYKFHNYILNDVHEYELPNGEIVVIPEIWFKKYKNVLKFAKKSKNNHFQLSKIHYFALQDTQDKKSIEKNTTELDKFFANPNKNSIKIPSNLVTKLRDYQKIGYSWLNHLQKNNFGGCLADDMGLGKTIQILSAILNSLEKAGQISKTGKYSKNGEHLLNLVIVPRSLLHNWLNEVKKNVPAIRAIIYGGNEREKLQKLFTKNDLIITSYGIARNDLDFLYKIE